MTAFGHIRFFLACLIGSLGVSIWVAHEATGWSPIEIDAPILVEQPREVWA